MMVYLCDWRIRTLVNISMIWILEWTDKVLLVCEWNGYVVAYVCLSSGIVMSKNVIIYLMLELILKSHWGRRYVTPSRAWMVMRWSCTGEPSIWDIALGTARRNTQCRMIMHWGRRYLTPGCIELWMPIGDDDA